MNINKNALIAVILIAGPAFLIWPNSTGGAAIWTINGFLALIPSIKAARKGRDFIPWLVYSMVFWVCQEFCVNRFNKQHRIAA